MSLMYNRVLHVVKKPPEERTDAEVEQILPWFRKKSDSFQNLHTDIVRDIVKNCKFSPCKRDTVVIRQGDKGDCFFIILSGSVVIHINTTMTEEEYEAIKATQLLEEEAVVKEESKGRQLDRSKYGNYVGKMDAGKTFGELALINADCVRNATIIADEPSDLLSVDRDLYNRSLKAFQVSEFEERKSFVANFPMFHNWMPRYKKMMAMSLKKQILKFQDTIVKQGTNVDGIHFVVRGQVKVRVDPSQHSGQYPHLYPLGDIADMEKEKARELLRKEMNLERQTRTNSKSTYARRTYGTTDGRKFSLKPVELCLVGAIDTIGDMEMAMSLSTYSQTVECMEQTTVFHLDQRNYDRLIEKRNPGALDMIRDIVHTKLTLHFSRLTEDAIPLYRFFLYTLDEKERDARVAAKEARERRSKTPQESEANIENLQKGPLVNMYGPGSVFYLIRMRAKQMKFRQQRGKNNNSNDAARLGLTPKGMSFGFGAAKALVSNIGAQAQNNAQTSFVNMYGSYQQSPNDSVANIGYLDESYEEQYIEGEGEGEDEVDAGEEDDEEEDADFGCSDSALTELEDRISQWHNSLGTTQKGSSVVRLHRFQYEDDNRPKPGNKVYVKVKPRPKNVSFLTFQAATCEESDDVILNSTADPYDGDPSNENTDRNSHIMSELADRPQTSQTPYRQQSFLVQPRPRTTAISGGNQKKRKKQYTAEEYQQLKALLRTKQKQWISLFPRRSSYII